MSEAGQAIREGSSDEPTGNPMVFIISGIVVGILLVMLLGWILDDESKGTVLWQRGRYMLVILTAFCGSMTAQGKGRVVAENVECFAIAVVMALILKHFIIEAYKIPTGSMQPTILGNSDVGIFDRVLVNKSAYLCADPDRYDVVVFKYPLDRSKNYIKRLVGLGNEQVSIFNGNIYIAAKDSSGDYGPARIARKPRGVRDSVLKTLFPSGRNNESVGSMFRCTAGEWAPSNNGFELSSNSTVRFGDTDAIRDGYLDGYRPEWGIPNAFRMAERGTETVGDLSLAFDVTPGDCTSIEVILLAYGLEHRAIIGVGDGNGTRIESGEPGVGMGLKPPAFYATESAIVASEDDLHLTAGKSASIAFYHVDQELVLEIDGDEVLTFQYEVDAPLYPSENGVEWVALGGSAKIEDPVVKRDIHYTTPGNSRKLVFEVPEDHLFVLGDNTQNSSDGRAWAAQQLEFPGGNKIITEYRQPLENNVYTDIYGEKYPISLRNQPRISRIDGQEFNFVPTRLLLGKAIAVFWPIYPHFRWKFIR